MPTRCYDLSVQVCRGKKAKEKPKAQAVESFGYGIAESSGSLIEAPILTQPLLIPISVISEEPPIQGHTVGMCPALES